MLRRLKSSNELDDAEDMDVSAPDFGGDEARGSQRSFDRQQAERRTVEELRAELQWHFAPDSGEREHNAKRGRIGAKPGFGRARIALLAVAVVAGGLAAFMTLQRSEPAVQPVVAETAVEAAPQVVTTKILVATANLSPGEKLTADALGWVAWPTDSVRPDFVTFDASPEAMTEMTGSVARSEIFAGDPITPPKLSASGSGLLATVLASGMRGVSVPVAAESASGGFITPDDHVDVVLTRKSTLGEVSETILRNVRVLAVNSQVGGGGAVAEPDSGGSATFSNQAIATLELTPAKAEVLVNSIAVGKLALVLRSVDDLADAQSDVQSGANQSIRLSSPFWTN